MSLKSVAYILTRCGTQVPRDGRPAEYRCRPLLNAGEQIAKMSLSYASGQQVNTGDDTRSCNGFEQ